MPFKNKDEKAEYQREYHLTHKEELAEYYLIHKEEFAKRGKEYRLAHKEERAKRQKECYLILRKEVLTHYGDGNLACVGCGFNDIDALAIDHINGDGAEHRRRLGLIGIRFYKWLKESNYPEGFQTLCRNCNWLKMIENKEYLKGKTG